MAERNRTLKIGGDKMNNNDSLLERIKEQIRIWDAYFNEHGCYRDDTIFLDTGDTAVYDPYVSECMRFEVEPKAYYGEKAYQEWERRIVEFIERGNENE